FGLGVDKTWAMCGRQWAAKFEGRYIKDRYYELNAAQYTPQNRGYTKLDSLLTGIQLETYFLTNLTAILRWDIETRMRWHDYIRDLPVGKNIDRCQNGVYLTLMKPIIATHNRLNLRSMLIWVEAGGWRYEPAITYELSECLELMLAGYLYWGNYDEINGQFTKHDGGSFGIKYSF
ncbi:MAG: hypothetical protein SVW57_07245, partial [Thermodesulfobacteriota bacterium]|nr:hypothetical protein [Thermodesulfobacteriota bacterium]